MTTHNTTYMARCEDEANAIDWLRGLAMRLEYASVWVAFRFLRLVGTLIVRIADALQYLRHGRTAVLQPSRTGGDDHSMRAVLAGHSPMVQLGGGYTDARRSECEPLRRSVIIRTVMTSAGWTVVRRYRLVKARFTQTGYVVTYEHSDAQVCLGGVS